LLGALSQEESISFKPPTLSEEEQDGHVLPSHMKCDACRAMAHQMKAAFVKAEKRISIDGTKPLPEHE
jgi:hypothetical protein